MSGAVPFWRLFFHVVWATRNREPLIGAEEAERIEWSFRSTCDDLRATLYAVGIMPDHVHIAFSIPPKLSIADFVGRLKGASAHAVNHGKNDARPTPFVWQAEYGVFSFSGSALPKVKEYLLNQETHHAHNDLWPGLERDSDAT